MRLSGLLFAWIGGRVVHGVIGHPGVATTINQLQELHRRQDGILDSQELIGDLLNPPLTPIGQQIAMIITSNLSPVSDETYEAPGAPGTKKCSADPCCVWKHVADDMYKVFKGSSGRCTKFARYAVRLGFHDAGSWSKFTGPDGGADGSILLSDTEMLRPENNGLQEIAVKMRKWYAKFSPYDCSMADLIQMGATVATVTCPLGPRIRSFVGRVDNWSPAPEHLLPPVTGSADFLIELFRNKTIGPHGLTALIGSHTTSQQRFVDPARALDPQDPTPGVWDVLFYAEILGLVKKRKRVFTFQSDAVLSQHPMISQEFAQFAGPGGQAHWNLVCLFSDPFRRLRLQGVILMLIIVTHSRTLRKSMCGSVFWG
jgi:manganese peroxidase